MQLEGYLTYAVRGLSVDCPSAVNKVAGSFFCYYLSRLFSVLAV